MNGNDERLNWAQTFGSLLFKLQTVCGIHLYANVGRTCTSKRRFTFNFVVQFYEAIGEKAILNKHSATHWIESDVYLMCLFV